MLEILSRAGISESFIYSGECCSHYFLTLGSVYISAGVIVEPGRRSHAWIASSETVTEASPSWHLMLPKKVLGSFSSNLNFLGFFFFWKPSENWWTFKNSCKKNLRCDFLHFCHFQPPQRPSQQSQHKSSMKRFSFMEEQLSLMTCAQRPNRLFFLFFYHRAVSVKQ